MKVLWTEQALVRLVEIQEFVAADNPDAAHRLIAELTARAEALGRFPHSGRRLPELPAGDLRELIERGYRIVYRIRRRTVEVLTVFEGHRLLPEEDLPGA